MRPVPRRTVLDAVLAHGTPRRRPAFSLAELMIALVILGLGLLFIAAALPVGLEYTRQTVELTTAEAAGQYALDQLELSLRTSRNNLYDPSIALMAPGTPVRLDNIHRPRDLGAQFPLAPKYEPLFKVRPLVMGNIRVGRLPGGAVTREIVDDVEVVIANYASMLGEVPGTPSLEIDFALTAGTGWSLAENQMVPGLARVYPPIEPVTTFTVDKFFPPSHDDYPTYDARFRTLDWQQLDREREKALDRRVAWTVFYRRVAYDEPGPNPLDVFELPGVTSNDILRDPLLYELIIVVTRRATVNHRFPRQDLIGPAEPFRVPAARDPRSPPTTDDFIPALGYGVGTDRLAPMPWLVMFDRTDPAAVPLVSSTLYDTTTPYSDRTLKSSFPGDPPTLTFLCTPEVGALLPVGSIFIPAFNDNFRRSAAWTLLLRQSGFVPHAPHTVPIYEVVERPDESTVVVKNNGSYPWLAAGLTAEWWPVWVIPPAFVERDSSGQPIYANTSPILRVYRRTVTLRELTP